ncbi:MAG: hypothetical protein ACK4K9_09000 [Bacteroidia bacterium]
MFYRVTLILLSTIFFIGCFEPKTDITFAEDIAPIIYKNCTKCHIDGEAGPFNLVTYEDVAGKAKLIEYITENRIMPPWPANPHYSTFANQMVLQKNEIDLIKKWIENGLKPGDTTKLKPYIKPQQKILGKPDLVLKLPKPIPIKGNNKDLFLVVKIPFELPNDTFIKAIEFVPGNKRLVHHMNAHLILFEPNKKQNLFDGNYWIEQDQAHSQTIHKQLGLLHDDGSYPAMTPSVCNYLPGAMFTHYPNDIGGYKVTKKAALYLNDLHYGPSAIDDLDSSYFNIYFDSKPPARPVSEFQIGTLGIVPVVPELIVPPNSIKSFNITFKVPQDISILTIVPHMHLIGKSYLAFAVKPSGDTIPLIKIDNWGFRWQYFYQPPNLLYIPRGSTIFVKGTYDNTAQNPNNPFNPPQEIKDRQGSMKTTDEMFQLIINYVPYLKGDEKIKQEK